ncbi:hypothetical protein ACQ4PT_016311 [Festuca glaucescens]
MAMTRSCYGFRWSLLLSWLCCLLLSPHVASSPVVITHLPGFDGPLPFLGKQLANYGFRLARDDAMDAADNVNREVELQLATIEMEDGDHHGQEHGTPTPSPSPTPSPDGALRLRAPGKGLVLGQRPAPPASGSNAQNRRGSTPVTSGTRGRPPLSAAAKHKNKNKAVTTCVTVDETSAPMDVDGGHVVISDDEDEQEEDVVAVNGAGKRKKTSNVWLEMKEVKVKGEYKARCNYCHKDLTTGPKAGTKHLADHLKMCTLKKLKTKGGKTMSQSSLMMNAKEDRNVSVESYTFDQEVARRELGNMLVLHEYPPSIVDHAGFRKFVHALQPLFKLHTRNTYSFVGMILWKTSRKKQRRQLIT